MADVIDLLERMGQDPAFREAAAEGDLAGFSGLALEAPVLAAICAGDLGALRVLMNQTPLCSVIMPAEEEEDGEDEREESPGRDVPSDDRLELGLVD